MAKDFNYRQLNNDLEAIVDRLQIGELDIDEALKQYERGVAIVKQLQDYLKMSENKITKAKQSFSK